MLSSVRAAAASPKANRLLAALPDAEYQQLLPTLERVPMQLGEAVYESGGPQGHVYFPTTSIVSLLYVLADGATAEIAVTGNEGLVGINYEASGSPEAPRVSINPISAVAPGLLRKLIPGPGSADPNYIPPTR